MKLYKEAERLYLKENLSVDKIAVQLDISRRTLFYWKKKYKWDKYLSQKLNKTDFNFALTNFAQAIMKRISKNIDSKTLTSPAQYYTLMKLMKYIDTNSQTQTKTVIKKY
jgi:transposase-like protein